MPALASELGKQKLRIWILSDRNTEAAAAAACKELLARFVLGGEILQAQPRPRTTPELVERLSKQAGDFDPDLIVAVGAGTISDVCKKVSHNLSVPNWCVATAPSVDAYSSGTSAIKLREGHRTEPAQPSELIFAELSVLEQAPAEMFLAGLGDLLGKFLSYLDWKLSALISGEHICEEAGGLCLDSARQAIEAAKSAKSDKKQSIRALTDAILTSGFAMQGLINSRPASSAEHTIAHFWEIAHTAGNPAYDLHGLLVGLSSRILLGGYKIFFSKLNELEVDIPKRLESFAAESEWRATLGPEVETFVPLMNAEMAQGRLDRATLEGRLRAVLENRRDIVELAGMMLDELAEAVAVLETVDFPFHLSDFLIDPEKALIPIRYVRFLRNRYSTFNLIYEIGLEREIFGFFEQSMPQFS